MKNTILSACLAVLALAACDASQNRRFPGLRASASPRLANPVSSEREVSLPASPELPTMTDGLPETVKALPVAAEDLSLAEPVDALALPHEEHLYPVDHLARARALRQEEDLSGALTEARRAVHDAADDVDAAEEALDTVILLARLTGQKQLASDAYGELSRIFPDGPEPLIQQARLLLELGDTTGAFRAAETAVELDPEYPEGYQVLGRVHLTAGELDEAILRFQQAVHLDPYHGYALNNLGLALLQSGKAEQAAEVLAQASYLLPQVAYVHNNLGLAYERLGRLEEARMAFDTATRLSPNDAKARLNRDRLNRHS
ncbi:MAG TPA: tetratricopeptide repeat protein [Archangium sp.]|jgi:tetratricopeptide (TPR) repeat protein|uniref:tetratricopeptide repeat protein n=1 Tax=Archangium sp. TaxID=1872627 RepID=UPI002ED9B0C4